VVRNTVATVSREILDFVANDKKRTNVRVSLLERKGLIIVNLKGLVPEECRRAKVVTFIDSL